MQLLHKRISNLHRKLIMANFKEYGKHVFRGNVAKPYLETQGLEEKTLLSSAWTMQPDKADRVRKSSVLA
jgi:hypothetical protein